VGLSDRRPRPTRRGARNLAGLEHVRWPSTRSRCASPRRTGDRGRWRVHGKAPADAGRAAGRAAAVADPDGARFRTVARRAPAPGCAGPSTEPGAWNFSDLHTHPTDPDQPRFSRGPCSAGSSPTFTASPRSPSGCPRIRGEPSSRRRSTPTSGSGQASATPRPPKFEDRDRLAGPRPMTANRRTGTSPSHGSPTATRPCVEPPEPPRRQPVLAQDDPTHDWTQRGRSN
jgi:hypothetical protein